MIININTHKFAFVACCAFLASAMPATTTKAEADSDTDDNPNNGDNGQDPAFPYGARREPRRGYGGYYGYGGYGGLYYGWPYGYGNGYGYGSGYGKRSADSTGVVRVANREAKSDPDVDSNNGDNGQDPAFPYGAKRESRNRYYGYPCNPFYYGKRSADSAVPEA